MTAKKLALMFLIVTLITQCLTEVYEKCFFLLTDKKDLLSYAGGVTPAGTCFIQDKHSSNFNQISVQFTSRQVTNPENNIALSFCPSQIQTF